MSTMVNMSRKFCLNRPNLTTLLSSGILTYALIVSASAHALAPASASVVYKGVQDALEQVQSVAETAGAEVRGTALQLERQLKELLAVLDETLKGRINESFDRLDESQKLLTRNSQETLESTLAAINSLRAGATADALVLLHEADIAAYNALYSLPCRDKNPRIVYTEPKAIRVGSKDIAQLTIYGNFLRLGDAEPVVHLDDTPLKIDELGDNNISVSLPQKYLFNLKKATAASLKIDGLTRISSFNLVVACPSFDIEVRKPIRAKVVVRPTLMHRVTAQLIGTVVSEVRHPNALQYTHTEHAASCSTNTDATRQYCLPPGSNWTVGRADVSGVYTRCPSSVQTPQVAQGDRCANVPARLVSCGRRWGDCKGTGKISYTITLEAVERVETPLKDVIFQPVTLQGPEKASTAFSFKLPNGANSSSLRYAVTISTSEGDTKLRDVTLTSTLGYQDGYRAELDGTAGLLTVVVPAFR